MTIRATTTAGTTTATSSPDPQLEGSRPGADGAASAYVEELFARHGRMVLGLCRALLRDHAEAEDAAQQTFLSALRALHGGSAPREPAAWLATIARNECVGRARKRMREPLALEWVETAGSLPDAYAEAVRRTDLAAVWRAIEALPPQQRSALLMREFAGLSYADLAAALAVSEPAVESLLSRARTRLRVQLRTLAAALDLQALRELALRFLDGGGAAKVGVATVGVALVTAGGAAVRPHRTHPEAAPPAKVVGAALPVAWAHRMPPLRVPVAATPVAAPAAPPAPPVRRHARDHGRGEGETRHENDGGAREQEHGRDHGTNGRDGTDRTTALAEPTQEPQTRSGGDGGGGGDTSDGGDSSGEGSGG